MIEKTLNVEGMSYGHCKAAVEEELNRLSGVEYSNADPQTGTVEVRFDESRTTDADLEGAVEEAGYTLKAS
jgi:copper chaperone